MTKEAKDWLNQVAEANKGMIENSNVYAGMVTANFLKDPVCALQLGYAIMMEKPIVLLVQPGVNISSTLRKVADQIHVVDLQDKAGVQAALDKIAKFLKTMEMH